MRLTTIKRGGGGGGTKNAVNLIKKKKVLTELLERKVQRDKSEDSSANDRNRTRRT